MFGKILLDDDDWLVTVELTGRVSVTLKTSGYTREVSKEEGVHFISVLESAAGLGVSIESGDEDFAEMVRDFTESFLDNGNSTWKTYFQTPPDEVALRYAIH